jgi:uncharacterized protein with HEPN domain
MVEAAGHISLFLKGIREEDFVHNEIARSAVLQKLTVIGEAAARLPADFRKCHPEVDWAAIVSFRNIIVHSYFQIQWSIIWVSATEEVPRLKDQLIRILALDFPP